jgi:hypothetical protein
MVDVPTSLRSARIATLRRSATIRAVIRTAAVLTSLRNAAIAICRRTATTIAGLRSPAPIVRHRLAHTVRRRLARIVHRPRARTQSRGRTLRPGLILPRPRAIRRPPVPIPHQAKVTAVVVVAAGGEVTAAALVVVAEVHVAGVPLRIRGTKFISQLRARSLESSGRASIPSSWVFEMHPSVRFST